MPTTTEPSVKRNGEPQTASQSVSAVMVTGPAPKSLPISYRVYRMIRAHPTVAVARALTMAPVIAGNWSVVAKRSTPSERKEFVEDTLLPLRDEFVETALAGGTDFGWAPFEKVFDADPQDRTRLKQLKPLLHDITDILVEEGSGAFLGFQQPDPVNGLMDLPLEYSLNLPFRVEGSNWYGCATLENARKTFNKWNTCDDGADRYDAKQAGSHFVIHYPVGTSPDGLNGAEVDNAELADRLGQKLVASGYIILPVRDIDGVTSMGENNPLPGWRIDVLSDGSPRQGAFVERLRYLDSLLVRSLLMPERAIVEGQFGTKAESEAHADLALTQRDLEHRYITRLFNRDVVDQLLVENWGPDARGSVQVNALPLVDEKMSFFRDIYKLLLGNPLAAAGELADIDWPGVRQAVGVPSAERLIQPENLRMMNLPGADTNTPLGRMVAGMYAREVDVTP